MRQLSPINELKRAINRDQEVLVCSSLSDKDICYSFYGTIALSVYAYNHYEQEPISSPLRKKFWKLRNSLRKWSGVCKSKGYEFPSISLHDLAVLKAKLMPLEISSLNEPRYNYSYTQEHVYDSLWSYTSLNKVESNHETT